jgi:hypothetical protein
MVEGTRIGSIGTVHNSRLQAGSQPLYRRTLGDAWNNLSPQIQQLHSVAGESSFVGECSVERGRHPLAGLVAMLIGFPDAGPHQQISVSLVREGHGERWVRQVGKRRFTSVQEPGRGRYQSLIREHFGPIAVHLSLVVDGESLRYVIRQWTFFGIPLPLSIGPLSRAVETVESGRFRFDVEIRHFLIGLVVRYQGTLSPATDAARAE